MKKIVLLTLCIAGLFSCNQKRSPVIERSAFATRNTLNTDNKYARTFLVANNEVMESVLNDLPQTTQEKMFDAILSKYKGKVVLVDFWATWCAPCMVAMKSILPMKEEMKGKDVVFLYLTGETSPPANFAQIYPSISGEHYYVNAAQWIYWVRTFPINGIPTYKVYDRSGRQINTYSGFPGITALKRDIEKGL